MIKQIIRRFRKNERGAAMVEFALAIVILLAFIFGIIEFAWILHGHITLTGAVREGARLAVTSDYRDKSDAEIKSEIRQVVMTHARTFQLTDGEEGDIKIEFGKFEQEESRVWVEEAELPLLIGFIPFLGNTYVIRNVEATMMHE